MKVQANRLQTYHFNKEQSTVEIGQDKGRGIQGEEVNCGKVTKKYVGELMKDKGYFRASID